MTIMNTLWKNSDADNRARALNTKLNTVPTFHELWSTNGLKPDRSFYHPYDFVPSQSIAHPLSGINVAPHSYFKWYGIGFVCTQIRSLKRCSVGNAVALVGLNPLKLSVIWWLLLECYRPNLSFLFSDIRALWRSRLSTRVPECQKLKMWVTPVWQSVIVWGVGL